MTVRGVREAGLNGGPPDEHAEAFTPTRLVRDGKVLRGRDGWLFLAGDTNDVLGQHTGELALDVGQLDGWRAVLEARHRMLFELGARFLFAIAPDTHAVYPEKLPEHVRPIAERPVISLRDHLAASESPVEPIYLLEDLLEARRRRLVCFPVDTHWNEYGGFAAYSRILDEIEQSVPVRRIHEDELIFFEHPMVGDLSYKLDPRRKDTMTYAAIPNASARIVEDNCIEGTGSVIATECPDAKGSCVLVSDSYAWALVKPLAESFGRFTFVHMRTFDADFIAAREPDVVINLIAERFLIHVPDDESGSSVEARVRQKRSAGRVRDPVDHWDHTISPSLESVERMRAMLLAEGGLRDATILSLLAYAGLQPAEIVALRWLQIADDELTVRALTKPWKAERISFLRPLLRRYRLWRTRKRVVPLLPEVVQDLQRWREAVGPDVDPRELVFQGEDAGQWRSGDWQAWRDDVYKPLAESLGVDSRAPYECRHVFSTLLIHSGVTPKEVGRRLGTTRERVFTDYDRHVNYANLASTLPVSQQIARARSRAAESVRDETQPRQPTISWP